MKEPYVARSFHSKLASERLYDRLVQRYFPQNLDLSIFQIEIEGRPTVVILGKHAREEMVNSGQPCELEPIIYDFLVKRRADHIRAFGPGHQIVNHYEPGIAFNREDLDGMLDTVKPNGVA